MKQLTLFEPIEIQLSTGHIALVDPIDADLASLPWCPIYSGTTYAGKSAGKRKTITMHSIVLERVLSRSLLRGELVDHIDGNGLNNRRSNLRLANSTLNGMNARRRRDNTSGFKGVSWDAANKTWQARISINKKQIRLGRFDTPQEAYAAYCDAALRTYGEFARLE